MDALSVIILAAGKGSRMKSDLPKVLHKVAGKPMIMHVIDCARQVVPVHQIHVVVGHQSEKVQQAVSSCYKVNFCMQRHLLGTGDAVKCALPALASEVRDVVVLYGDVPMIQPETVMNLVSSHRNSRAKVTILAADLEHPTGYGRVLLDPHNYVVGIREETDASEDEKKIKRINTGIYCFDRRFLTQALDLVKQDNQQGEFYLTDVVGIACRKNQKTAVKMVKDSGQVLGINTLDELEKTSIQAVSIQNELP
jgi:bifunctional UDP-N-acetylglucosamine pyrophosphorylase/glucosamine-1-phosphate N-acetyltransferase/UDP-N-acetylglucosamine pyrophosphorylase